MAQSANAANTAPEFVFNRTFDAAREDVWDAFTQREHLKHWWGPPGCRIEIAHLELKPGGLFHYSMKLPDGRVMWARFVYREISPPERLVWLNGFSDENGGLTRNPWIPNANYPLETLSTLTLAERDGKTQLTITAVPFQASDEEALVFAGGINGMKMGFGAGFKLLADYLARRARP